MTILVHLSNLLLCEALEELLRRCPAGWQVISRSAMNTATCLLPDLVLIDPANLNQCLFSRWPDAKFILLDTGLPLHNMVKLLCFYRLDGIISTDTDFQLFTRALAVVQSGQVWIDNCKLKALLRSKSSHTENALATRLTDREKQIMDKIVEGFRNKEIAEKLYVSEQTVKSHINHIFSKLGVTSRSQLVSLFVNNYDHDQ